MVELRILKGFQAGSHWTVRHFPVRIGRGQDSDLVLEDDGVWEDHAEIGFDEASGFYMVPTSEGAVVVNGYAVESAALRNGDVLTLGGAEVQFWLAPPRQKRFRLIEILLGLALLGLFAVQLLLIRWLG